MKLLDRTYFLKLYGNVWGFPDDSVSKESACNVGEAGQIPRLGRSPGEKNGYPFQYSCLENPMGRGAWEAIVHRVAELDMTEVTQDACTHFSPGISHTPFIFPQQDIGPHFSSFHLYSLISQPFFQAGWQYDFYEPRSLCLQGSLPP